MKFKKERKKETRRIIGLIILSFSHPRKETNVINERNKQLSSVERGEGGKKKRRNGISEIDWTRRRLVHSERRVTRANQRKRGEHVRT